MGSLRRCLRRRCWGNGIGDGIGNGMVMLVVRMRRCIGREQVGWMGWDGIHMGDWRWGIEGWVSNWD